MELKAEDADALLYAALQRYCPEPRAGIEDRVLRSVRVRTASPRRFPLWLALVPVAALLLVAVLLQQSQAIIPIPPPPVPTIASAPAEPFERKLPPLPPKHKPHAPRHVTPFPTPSPLTAEEQMLRRLAARDPQTAQALLARSDAWPLEIKALEITPLENNQDR